MYQIIEKANINQNIESLFGFTQDFEKRIEWDSQTKSISFMNTDTILKRGSKVTVISSNGVKMNTVYTIFTPPLQLSIKMLNNSPIFSSFNGSWKYKKISDEKTELSIEYQFRLKILYKLLSPIVISKIRNNMKQKLIDLSYAIDNRC